MSVTSVPLSSGPDQRAAKVSALRLFAVFLRLGLTAFGGPAMVAYIRDLAVEKHRWLSREEFDGGAALCQSIPGATAMQAAAYVGLRAGGPAGALGSFVGFGMPAFALMIVLSAAYRAGHDLHLVVAAFHGLHVIVVAVIANAALSFGRSSIKGWGDALLAAGAAAFLASHGSPIIAIAASAGLGIVVHRGLEQPVKAAPPATRQGARQALTFAAFLVLLAAAALVVLLLLDRRLFELAAVMLRVDLFAFGGGFASVPLMLHEIVGVRGWLDGKAFMDGIALGQVTPGPIVITATFVGFQLAGLLGAVVGTLAIFTPSFVMLLATAPYLDRLLHSRWVRRASRGVLASFVGLLVAVTINFAAVISWSLPAGLIAAAALVALRYRVDVLWVVLAGAAVSIIVL